MTQEPSQVRNCRIFSLTTGVISVLVGSLAMLGWVLHVPVLTSVVPGFVTMKPLTALGFMLCGLSVCSLRLPAEGKGVPHEAYLRVGQILGGMVMCLALLTLGEYLFSLNFGIDEALFRPALLATGRVHPGRMSASSAAGFFFLASALLAMDRTASRYVSQGCALLTALDGLVAFVGYVYGVRALYGMFAYSSMALHTAALMVLLGLATLAARPQSGLMATVTSRQLGGLMVRWTLPLAVVLPIFVGWVRWRGELAGLYATAFGTSIFALSNVIMFTTLLLLTGAWINRADAARQKAEESDLRLASIVESSVDPIIGVDLNGLVTSWNKSAEKLFGYSGREIIGRSFNVLIPPDRRTEELKILQRIRLGERVEPGETVRICKDGRAIAVSSTISPLRDPQGNINGAAKIVRDITESKRAALEIRQQAEVLDLAQVLVRDMDNRIVLWNTGAEKLYGFRREQALGQDPNKLLRTRFPVPFEEVLQQFLKSGQWEGELIHTRSDGREIAIASLWVMQRNPQGLPIRILEANTDITAQKLAQQQLTLQADELARQADEVAGSRAALAEQTRMLQSVLDNIGDGLVATDRQGNFVLWNPAADRILGKPKADVPVEQWAQHYQLYLPDQTTLFPADKLPLAAAIQGQETETVMFVRGVKAGKGGWIEVSGRPLFDENYEIAGGVVAFRDITQRKLADREIRKLNFELELRVQERTAQLETANRELESFSYSVSHDLRAPLRQISGFARILEEDFAPTMEPEAQKHLQRIQLGAMNMGRLVDELLNLSRLGKQPLSRQSVGLNQVVDEVIAILEPETEGRRIEWKIAPLPAVECDATLMKLVFQNLISNALKYSRTRSEACIEIGETLLEGESTVFVRDNGVGFDMKYATKLFGVFQRLHRHEEFEGIGIGLATTLSIVQKHGGRLWAEATPDQGATFYFTLAGQNTKAKTAVASSVDE